MIIFGTSTGAYVRKEYDNGQSIVIDGLLAHGLGGLVATGFRMERQDLHFIQRCFGGTNFVYGFGQDIGTMSVEALAFVTSKPCGSNSPSANFDTLEKNYLDNSLSSKGVIQVGFPSAGKTTSAFLTSLKIETKSTEQNLHVCAFEFLILDTPATAGAGSGTAPGASGTSPGTTLSTASLSSKFSQSTKTKNFNV